ncbi:hypothetical protein DSO57_1031825 [Entomophthora muscae]|uniref:Uncharacterized protein n=1 Tax=Entomophthora muscae TaxID=34485 RepID=A0ACC2ULC9_9FUNG|nr:hypothetical protein DSO57_1031825 [Entomophthora muscae]
MNWTNLSLGIMSIILNLLLLHIFFKVNNRSLSHTLIGVIATVDLASGICISAMCAINLVFGDVLFFKTRWHCNGIGMGIIFFTCMSSYLIGLLSAERYFRVSRYEGMSRRTALSLTVLVVAALSITSIGTSLNNGYKPDPTYVYCLPYGTNWSVAMFTVTKIVLTAPLPVLVSSYIGIFIHCSKRIRDFPILSKLVRMILFISVYCACFIPSMILIWCDFFSTLGQCPISILVSAPIVLSALPVANPFLVMFLHQQMAAAFSRFFSDTLDSLPKEPQIFQTPSTCFDQS